jgi:hypothetical protein
MGVTTVLTQLFVLVAMMDICFLIIYASGNVQLHYHIIMMELVLQDVLRELI